MRHAAILCLLLSACATPVLPTPVIENSVPAPPIPTLADNMAATVSVFYAFSNLSTGELCNQQVIGVVIDATHVLTFPVNEDDVAILMDWDRARIEYVVVAPFVPNTHKYSIAKGPAPANGLYAKIVAERQWVAILEVSESLPLPPVILATKKPHADEAAYTLGYKIYDVNDKADDKSSMRISYSTVAEPLMIYSSQYVFAQDFALKLVEYPTQCGVFNKRDELVGFLTNYRIEIASNNNWSSDDGYLVISLKSLAPLLREAGIPYNSAD